MEARPCEIVKSFGVKLVHTSEPSKFTFSAVKIAVVIFVGGDQLGLANVVNDLNLFHHLDGKGQVGGPVETIFFVFQVKLGGGGVLDAGGGPQVVVHLNQQMGFDAAAEIQSLEIAAGLEVKIVAPDQGGRAGAEYVGKLDGRGVGDIGGAVNDLFLAPAVAGLVQPEMHLSEIDID